MGLLAIAATIWVTLRAANPKRRLISYWKFPLIWPYLWGQSPPGTSRRDADLPAAVRWRGFYGI